MNRTTMILVAAAVLLVGGLGTWYYFTNAGNGSPSDNSASEQSSTGSPSKAKPSSGLSSQSTGESDQSEATTYPVSVYFSQHPQSDDDPSAVFAVSRTAPDLGVAVFSIKELLKGPSADEIGNGYFTTAHLQDGTGTDDFKITMKDGTATLQFLRQFDHQGVVADGQAESEIKTTLTQFSDIKKVVILNKAGSCEFDLSGTNRCME